MNPFRAGAAVSAKALNWMYSAAEAFKFIRAGRGITVKLGPWGATIECQIEQRTEFWAEITGKLSSGTSTSGSGTTGSGTNASGSGSGSGTTDDCKYSWKEKTSTIDSCGLVDKSAGRTGFIDNMPAIPVDGNPDIVAGTPVKLWLADSGDHYLFEGGMIEEDVVTCVQLLKSGDGSGSGTSGSGVKGD